MVAALVVHPSMKPFSGSPPGYLVSPSCFFDLGLVTFHPLGLRFPVVPPPTFGVCSILFVPTPPQFFFSVPPPVLHLLLLLTLLRGSPLIFLFGRRLCTLSCNVSIVR